MPVAARVAAHCFPTYLMFCLWLRVLPPTVAPVLGAFARGCARTPPPIRMVHCLFVTVPLPQGVVRELLRFRCVVWIYEAWSTSTCLMCFWLWGHVQRMHSIKGEHDHMYCPQCGRVERDPNAAGWIKEYAEFTAATGLRHPVSLDSPAEKELHEARRSAKPVELTQAQVKDRERRRLANLERLAAAAEAARARVPAA